MAGGGMDGFDDDGSGGTRDFMFGFAMGAFLGVISEWFCEQAVLKCAGVHRRHQ